MLYTNRRFEAATFQFWLFPSVSCSDGDVEAGEVNILLHAHDRS